jgi:hypothetical protein
MVSGIHPGLVERNDHFLRETVTWALWLVLIQHAPTDPGPIFPNNAQGWVSLVVSVTVLLGIIEGIRYALHVKPVEKDLSALGQKVDRMDKDQERYEEKLAALKDMVTSSHRDTMEAIWAAAKAQTDAIHQVDNKVTAIGNAASLTDAIVKATERLADRLEKALVDSDQRREGR